MQYAIHPTAGRNRGFRITAARPKLAFLSYSLLMISEDRTVIFFFSNTSIARPG